MRVVDRNAMVPYSPQQMYALVDDVEAYPEFLPWCAGARLLDKSDTELRASLQIGYSGLNSTFTTRNELLPPACMTMELVDGPFKQLFGRWEFTPLGEEGCEVHLRVEFAFDSKMKDMLFGATFEGISNEHIEAIIRRARELYG